MAVTGDHEKGVGVGSSATGGGGGGGGAIVKAWVRTGCRAFGGVTHEKSSKK